MASEIRVGDVRLSTVGAVKVPLDVALDGISLKIQDAPEAFHTLQAFIGLMKEESDDVQRVVVDALLVASGAVSD